MAFSSTSSSSSSSVASASSANPDNSQPPKDDNEIKDEEEEESKNETTQEEEEDEEEEPNNDTTNKETNEQEDSKRRVTSRRQLRVRKETTAETITTTIGGKRITTARRTSAVADTVANGNPTKKHTKSSTSSSRDNSWINTNVNCHHLVSTSSSSYRVSNMNGIIESYQEKNALNRIPAQWRCIIKNNPTTTTTTTDKEDTTPPAAYAVAVDLVPADIKILEQQQQQQQEEEQQISLYLTSNTNNTHSAAVDMEASSPMLLPLQPFPSTYQVRMVQERYQNFINELINKYNIFPKLLLLAALEETCMDFFQRQMKKRQQIIKKEQSAALAAGNATLTENTTLATTITSPTNTMATPTTTTTVAAAVTEDSATSVSTLTTNTNLPFIPPYYRTQPPSQYLLPPNATANEDDFIDAATNPTNTILSSHEGTTPSSWISRIKSSCYKLQQYYEKIYHTELQQLQQQQVNSMNAEYDMNRRVSSRLAIIQIQQQQEEGYDDEDDEDNDGKNGNRDNRMLLFLKNTIKSMVDDINMRQDEDEDSSSSSSSSDESDEDSDSTSEKSTATAKIIKNSHFYNRQHPYVTMLDIFKTIRKWTVQDIQDNIKEILDSEQTHTVVIYDNDEEEEKNENKDSNMEIDSENKDGEDNDDNPSKKENNDELSLLLERYILLPYYAISSSTTTTTTAAAATTNRHKRRKRVLHFKLPKPYTVSKLNKLEITQFARVKIPLISNKDIDDKITEEEEKEEEEQLEHYNTLLETKQYILDKKYKSMKTWYNQRYKGIHYGYTKWPSWIYATQMWWKKEKEEKKKMSQLGQGKSESKDKNSSNLSNDQNIDNNNADHKPVVDPKPQEKEEEKPLFDESAIMLTTNRRTRAKISDSNNDNSIFYGSSTNISQKQLFDTILRFVKKQDYIPKSLFDFYLAMEDTTITSNSLLSSAVTLDVDWNRKMKRLQAAIGKLLYKRNQLLKFPVNCKLTDEKIFINLLSSLRAQQQLQLLEEKDKGEKPTMVLSSAAEPKIIKDSMEVDKPPPTDIAKETKETSSEIHDVGTTTTTNTALVTSNTTATNNTAATATAIINEDDDTSISVMKEYIKNLQIIELQLRKIIIKQLTKIPIPVIATAADDRTGTPDAMDETDFIEKKEAGEDDEEDDNSSKIDIKWQSSGHEYIGKNIFRPPSSEIPEINIEEADNISYCKWYKIKEYSLSVPVESDETQPTMDDEPPAVERRKRFLAISIMSDDDSDVDEEDEDAPTLILTEPQVQAGIIAADLKRKQKQQNSASRSRSYVDHPFASGLGKKLRLHPIALKKVKKSKVQDDVASEETIDCTVVGHDTVIGEDGNLIYKMLLLPVPAETKSGSSSSVMSSDETDNDSFWTTVQMDNKDKNLTCQRLSAGKVDAPNGNEKPFQSTTYKIEQFEFDSSSLAYKECESVLNYLINRKDSEPFMEPVDPEALGIPTYFDVIKRPMDISTVTKKLEEGVYSNIPPISKSTSSPVSRMLNGPFRKDIELIFDNAMKFNQPGEWIHTTADKLKKLVLKKIEQLSIKADQYGAVSGSGAAAGGRSSRHSSKSNYYYGSVKKSVYVDEDSDVDLYEYESDYDDEYDPSSRRSRGGKRKRSSNGKRNSSAKDDYSSRAVENPIRLQKSLSETMGLRGPFANFPVKSEASSFSLPSNWSCCRSRQRAVEVNVSDPDATKKTVSYEDKLEEFIELHLIAASEESVGTRRSTRTHAQTKRKSENSRSRGSSSAERIDFEYLLLDSRIIQLLEKKASKKLPDDQSTNSEIDFEHEEESLLLNLLTRTRPKNRQEIEHIREHLHESFYAKRFHELAGRKGFASMLTTTSPVINTQSTSVPQQGQSAVATDTHPGSNSNDYFVDDDAEYDIGMFMNSSFPPFLGHIVPSYDVSANANAAASATDDFPLTWEIRSPFVIPALRWVIRGLIQSGHLSEVESLTANANDLTAGVVLPNHVYYWDRNLVPFEILDVKELQRRKRENEKKNVDDDSEDDVEMSEYEKQRAERVARNAERLKALGLG